MSNTNGEEKMFFVLVGRRWESGDATTRITPFYCSELTDSVQKDYIYNDTIGYTHGTRHAFTYDGKTWFDGFDSKTGELTTQLTDDEAGEYIREWESENVNIERQREMLKSNRELRRHHREQEQANKEGGEARK